MKAIAEKTRRFLMRCLAHGVLERRAGSTRLSVKGELVAGTFRDRIAALSGEAFGICSSLEVCRSCRDSRCCGGGFSRVTILDSILNNHGKSSKLEWGYVLYPFGSYEKNRCDKGWCEFFMQGKGCDLPADKRPASCITYLCDELKTALDPASVLRIRDISMQIDRAHLSLAVRLAFFPGMWEDSA